MFNVSNPCLRVQAASVEVEVVVREEHPREVVVGIAVGLTLSRDTCADISSQVCLVLAGLIIHLPPNLTSLKHHGVRTQRAGQKYEAVTRQS